MINNKSDINLDKKDILVTGGIRGHGKNNIVDSQRIYIFFYFYNNLFIIYN